MVCHEFYQVRGDRCTECSSTFLKCEPCGKFFYVLTESCDQCGEHLINALETATAEEIMTIPNGPFKKKCMEKNLEKCLNFLKNYIEHETNW